MRHLIFVFVILFCAHNTVGQVIDYTTPKEYEIGPISINGADNFDHNALRLISGLKQGERIKIPGEEITKAIKNLWEEELFSDVQIYIDRVIGDIAYLSIDLKPRQKLSRFRFVGAKKKNQTKIEKKLICLLVKRITKI